MSTRIFYNNIDAFSGIAPVPLISQKDAFIKYGEQWGEVTHLSLYGNITGVCVGQDNSFFNALISGQSGLLQNFSKDFQNLQIIQDGQVLVNKPYCIIRSINFPESKYVSLLPFQIDLDCYESGFFSGVYGILEPKNEFVFTQKKDQSLTIQHNMSCRGFNTDSNNSNALQNSKNYIDSISGFNNQILPAFIGLCSGITPFLIDQKESINRMEGSYGLEETYIADPYFTSGVLRYSATYESGIEDGISKVKIDGSLKTSRNYPIDFVRSRYMTFDSFSAAVSMYSGATNGLLDLNPLYLSSGITEDPFAGIINFNILFNNDITPSPFIDYSVTFKHDLITDITDASFAGTIKGRGDLYNRYQKVLAFSSGVNVYNLTLGEYVNNRYGYILNPNFLSYSTLKNPYNGEITLGASYSDKTLPVSGFAYFDYHMNFKPSIEQYSSQPILNGLGSWWVTDLGFVNREVMTIEGKAVIAQNLSQATGIQLLYNYINGLVQPYINGQNRVNLDNQLINYSNLGIGKDLNFSVSYSWEGTPLLI